MYFPTDFAVKFYFKNCVMALTLQSLFSVKRIASVSEIKLHAVYCGNVNRNPGTYIITWFCREFIQEFK